VRRIGAEAFSKCSGLTSVSIPDGVSTIPNRAFFDCWSLTNVIIPASVTSIGGLAFAHCTSLKRILLPEHLADLGDSAFVDCTGLKAIYFRGDAPHLEGEYVFDGDWQATVYYLPGHTGWDTLLGGLQTVRWGGYPSARAYQGLFHVAGNVSWESAGAFAMRATAKGRFSGQLLLAGRRHSLSGAFDPSGQGSVTISRRNASALQVQFQMAGFEQITGSVSDGTWTAELTADRAVFDGKSSVAPQVGRYTMVIPGADPWSTTGPTGYGHGAITVDKSGQVRLSGALADNTKITQAASLSRDGVWPVYASLYRGQGLLLGWLTFINAPGADLSGLLQWNKPTAADGFYPGGFQSDTSVQGWRYTRPKAGAMALPFNKACLVLSGADLKQDLTNHVVLQANNRVTSTNKTTLTFNLSTGGLVAGCIPGPSRFLSRVCWSKTRALKTAGLWAMAAAGSWGQTSAASSISMTMKRIEPLRHCPHIPLKINVASWPGRRAFQGASSRFLVATAYKQPDCAGPRGEMDGNVALEGRNMKFRALNNRCFHLRFCRPSLCPEYVEPLKL
jgi:hypothetical protein